MAEGGPGSGPGGDCASIAQIGGLAAWGVAAAYIASGTCAVLMPPELQASLDVTPHQFWLVLSRDPLAHLAFHWSWVICGIFGLAAVPAISLLVWPRHVSRGLILWSGLLALVGFATLTRSHLMEVAWDRKIIPLYQHADPAFQQAVHVVAGLALDVGDGVLTYAAIGLWVLVVSIGVRRVGLVSLWFSVLGILAAVSLFAGTIGYTFGIRPAIVFSIGVGGFVLIPAWFIWAGMLIRNAPLVGGRNWRKQKTEVS